MSLPQPRSRCPSPQRHPSGLTTDPHHHHNCDSRHHPMSQLKDDLIQDILTQDDLYAVLGTPSTSTSSEIRKAYLDRARLVHPDRLPIHPDSTRAFQRLGFAYDILKRPSSRATYDRASRGRYPHPSYNSGKNSSPPDTFAKAVIAVLNEFIQGDFAIVRGLLEALQKRHPGLISSEGITSIERSFHRLRDLILTTRSYALLVSIELARINRAQRNLRSLGYLDVVGRVRLGVRLAKVTLAVPMRVDRALKMRKKREEEARDAGWNAAGIKAGEAGEKGGFLNERVLKVLEFIVGNGADDEEGDESWPPGVGVGTGGPRKG